MSTLVFSPGVRVIIDTARHGTLDVTDDIVRGNVTLALGRNGGHRMTLELTNDRRKYDSVFTPNDRFSIHMKRIKWLQVMSGYLDSVPMFSVYASSVKLSGSCTLKRLLYSLYDAGSAEVVNFLNLRGTGEGAQGSVDSNISEKIVGALTEFANWDEDKIHIGAIPVDWQSTISALYSQVSAEWDQYDSMLDSGTTIGGRKLTSYGSLRVPIPGGPGHQEGPGYGRLPKTSAKAGRDTAGSWRASMRWPYRVDATGVYDPFLGTGRPTNVSLSQSEVRDATNWWNRQRLLVVNPSTNRGVIVQCGPWGPPSNSGRGIDLSPDAFDTLGLAGDAPLVEIRFAPTDAPLGAFVPPPEPPRAVGTGSIPSGPTQVSEDGIVFRARGGTKANAAAAWSFIEKFFPGHRGIGGYRASGSVATSDHPRGLALDIMVCAGGQEPTPEQVAYGNALAYWFAQNPGAFGTKYIIWNNLQYTPSQVKEYTRSGRRVPTVTLGHRDHVHISFHETNQTALGPMGNGWSHVTAEDFMTTAALGGVPHNNRAGAISGPSGVVPSGAGLGTLGSNQLTTTWNWMQQGDHRSAAYYGPRVLMNDSPVKPLIDQLFQVAMRDYCSAPNGDIIAWFPDYFNLYGTAARMVIQTIELERFSIMWSDLRLVTHQFVTGTPFLVGYGAGATAEMELRKTFTHGIATVEQPEILRSLLNVDGGPSSGIMNAITLGGAIEWPDPVSAGWVDPDAILQRFGARVNTQTMEFISSPEGEFWAAVNAFRLSWASQFSTEVPISFMPELFPGMIMQIPAYGLQLYVDSVSHDFSFGPGGGFTTSVSVVAPSTIGAQKGLYGLPRGGAWVGADERGPAYGPVLAPVPGQNDSSTPRPPGNIR